LVSTLRRNPVYRLLKPVGNYRCDAPVRGTADSVDVPELTTDLL